MNIIQVQLNQPGQIEQSESDSTAKTVPVFVPELSYVRAFALQLHARGQEFKDTVWGWRVQYDPEINEESVEFQIPTGNGTYRSEYRQFWSPASFTIGESGVWFYSLL